MCRHGEREISPLEHQHSTVVWLIDVCSSTVGHASGQAHLHKPPWMCLQDEKRWSCQTLPFIEQFLTHCLCSGMKTWPGSLFKRPRNFTASWAWFWTTVWRTGSPTTPRAAAICHPSRSSPLSATLLLMQKTGGWSYPSTWWSSLKLPASHFWSSSVTRPSFTLGNWGIFHTLWWKTEHFTLYRD